MPGLMHGICDLPPMNAASLAYCAENREMASSYRLHLTSNAEAAFRRSDVLLPACD
jgi:hypothetical protein